MSKGWIGVDLDGTLAYYDGWHGPEHIGEPVPAMVERVKQWIREGKFNVKVFTARVSDPREKLVAIPIIQEWCLRHIGAYLPITCTKDFAMVELWDDRCIHVEHNTGRVLG